MSDHLKSSCNESNRDIKSIAYYPPFDDSNDLTNHYFRALWYLPTDSGLIDRVLFPTSKKLSVGPKPAPFGLRSQVSNDLYVVKETTEPSLILSSQLVLLWRKVDSEIIKTLQDRGVEVLNVDTHDIESIEYGVYCKILWRMLGRRRQKSIIEDSKTKLETIANRNETRNYRNAAVFGTGPSIETALSLDFSETFTVICNTNILDCELCDTLEPDVITAGDVVSHFGVSEYAFAFREKLANFLEKRETFFVTTAPFGFLFYQQYPSLRDKIILVEQRGNVPICNLFKNFFLPCLDSTLNIHMLPVAFTFFDDVFIFGCDGKSPYTDKNEDFWAHSKRTQMHELVETGHLSHPTFDQRRQITTWDRYQSSTELSCSHAESKHGKNIYVSTPSFTSGLKERYSADNISTFNRK